MITLCFIDEGTTQCGSPRQDLTGNRIACTAEPRLIQLNYASEKMNAKKLIAAAAIFAAAGSTFAAEVTEGVWPAFTPTKTRAEVVAELKAAQADGSYALAQQQYDGQFPQAAAQYAKAHGNANTAVAGRAVNNGQAN
jgi:hypothetical protein